METKLNFNEIYKKYHSELTQYVCYRLFRKSNMVKLDGEELVNDIFVKISKHIDNFDNTKAQFRTWLYTIANNTIIDWQRTKMLKQQHSMDGFNLNDQKSVFEFPDARISDNSNLYDDAIIRNSIDKSFSNLKGISKDIALLFFVSEYKLEEISTELNIPVGTVKGTIFRVRAKMQKELSNVY